MATAHVNIGSNTGDRLAQIERAVTLVQSRICGCHPVRRSSLVESDAWGYQSSGRYLNLGIAFEWEGDPRELLRLLLSVQNEISPASHRDSDGNYIDRIIDIDLIAVGDAVIDSADLVLPHPRMQDRAFVLAPMSELEPDWIHPNLKSSISQLLQRIDRQGTQTEKIEHTI